jgi:hypothetical protein
VKLTVKCNDLFLSEMYALNEAQDTQVDRAIHVQTVLLPRNCLVLKGFDQQARVKNVRDLTTLGSDNAKIVRIPRHRYVI